MPRQNWVWGAEFEDSSNTILPSQNSKRQTHVNAQLWGKCPSGFQSSNPILHPLLTQHFFQPWGPLHSPIHLRFQAARLAQLVEPETLKVPGQALPHQLSANPSRASPGHYWMKNELTSYLLPQKTIGTTGLFNINLTKTSFFCYDIIVNGVK